MTLASTAVGGYAGKVVIQLLTNSLNGDLWNEMKLSLGG